MDLGAIGAAVRTGRIRTGLKQEQLAKSTGLSRVTINQLENGSLRDLGYSKLKAVLDLLEIGLQAHERAFTQDALALAARSISTSYKDVISRDTLALALQSGHVQPKYYAHMMAFLDETPMPIALRAVGEAATPDVPPRKIMKHLSVWAREWKTYRSVWL